jgi:hypothetical protein
MPVKSKSNLKSGRWPGVLDRDSDSELEGSSSRTFFAGSLPDAHGPTGTQRCPLAGLKAGLVAKGPCERARARAGAEATSRQVRFQAITRPNLKSRTMRGPTRQLFKLGTTSEVTSGA